MAADLPLNGSPPHGLAAVKTMVPFVILAGAMEPVPEAWLAHLAYRDKPDSNGLWSTAWSGNQAAGCDSEPVIGG